MEVVRAAEGETVESSAAEIFQGGHVWARRIAGGDTGRGDQMSFGIVQFAAGARTKLHRHTSDQLLYVVAGIGKVGAGGEEHVITALSLHNTGSAHLRRGEYAQAEDLLSRALAKLGELCARL